MANQFTQTQLTDAFDKIKDPTDWKNPICARVKGEAVTLVVAAIQHFTATNPTVQLNQNTMDYIIESEGYRMGPAGDY
mgnify:CR=1 FL=1|jgi:hypothetical protein|tara:strand:- start:90 stop:323 length:234 start_codon:yes stop_codon:yes gene_type:complete